MIVGVLSLAMVMTAVNMPMFTVKVYASGAQLPSADAFATPAELKDANNFTLYSGYGRGKAQGVFFGEGHVWYIAGADRDGSLVLMHNPDSPIANIIFDDDDTDYRTSLIRSNLNNFTGATFTSEEKDLMNNTTVYTKSSWEPTNDKLYLAYGGYDPFSASERPDYITVGTNSSGDLNSGIKIGIGDNGPDNSLFKNGGADAF